MIDNDWEIKSRCPETKLENFQILRQREQKMLSLLFWYLSYKQ